MKVITAESVDAALAEGLRHLTVSGEWVQTRNGRAIRSLVPVTTMFLQPNNRILRNAKRDCNHYFHFFEFLWMITGCRNSDWLARYLGNIKKYAEPDGYFHGAYGYRWMHAFHINQVDQVIKMLRAPTGRTERRAVISMWDPQTDLNRPGIKDIPCNFAIDFKPNGDRLDMMVHNRSNDMIWGAYGANVVHFSFLHELVAQATDFEIGTYYQISDDFHAYEEPYERLKNEYINPDGYGYYPEKFKKGYKLLNSSHDYEYFMKDAQYFVDTSKRDTDSVVYVPPVGYHTEFFRNVVFPMHTSFLSYERWKKNKSQLVYWDMAYSDAAECHSHDWGTAVQQFLERRRSAYERAADDGVHAAHD